MPTLQTTLYSLLLVAAIAGAAEAGYATRRRRASPAAGAFAWLMIAAAVYAAGSAAEIASRGVRGKLIAIAFQYPGIASLPSLWLLVAWRWIKGRRPLPRPVALAMVVLPALTVLANWTNGLHRLYYSSVSLGRVDPFPVISLGKGPLYWVQTAYLHAALAAGNGMLLARVVRSRASERASAAIMVAGSLLPWVGSIVYVAGASPWGVDLGPFLLPASGALFAVGLFHYRMLDIVPIARERVFESMHDGVIIVDHRHRILDFNPAAAEICRGLTPLAIGSEPAEVLAEFPALVAALEAGAGSARLAVPAGSGTRSYDVRIQPVHGPRGRAAGMVVLLADVTEQLELMEKLRNLATIDELTGVANRRQFFELARREVARARREASPISVAIMDLDHFKSVNDRYGHAAGDVALRTVAAICRAGVRLSDVVGRYGGEELAFVFPDTDAGTAAEAAERLRVAIAQACITAGAEQVRVTASFGVAGAREPADMDVEALLQVADRALYTAKDSGRNRVVVYQPSGRAPENL